MPDRLFLVGRTQEFLGVDHETLLSMELREFYSLCMSKGIDPILTFDGVANGLTIDFDPESNVTPYMAGL